MITDSFDRISLTVSKPIAGGADFYPHLARVGVPFAIGQITDCNEFAVVAGESTLPGVFRPTAYWPDGSIKWCLASFICAGVDNTDAEFILIKSDDVGCVDNSADSIFVEQDDETIVVVDNGIEYRFLKNDDSTFPEVIGNGSSQISSDHHSVVVTSIENEQLHFQKLHSSLKQYDSISAIVEVRGFIFSAVQKKKVNVQFQFEVILGKLLSIAVEIHNPHRSRHIDGIWDLGDPGSFEFKEFSLQIKRNQDQVFLQAEPDGDHAVSLDSESEAILFQASSGGTNWDSPTHVNASGQSNNEFCGYSLTATEKHPIIGKRATPLLSVNRQDKFNYAVKMSQYWQNFPKSICVSSAELTIGLFPKEHTDGHELQGGEKKTHILHFSFGDSADLLDWVDESVIFSPNRDAVVQADVLANPAGSVYQPYDDLISVSLDSTKGIAAKRESQDEYGWRHFGEVVADHETLYHDADSIFVSHYNNQYDAVYGFARQFLLTTDSRWYHLMEELAQHVLDIDIYRTTEDRAEYNNGLFWHTDHYLQASTCSHRTYSSNHYPADWEGDKGGGPGSEHCYTTGLKLYYFLTGKHDAKQSVVDLACWIRNYYEGTGTVVERVKVLVSKDLRDLTSICRGEKVFRYRYGFDRGTGNYIRAMLDSYELTLDKTYLHETEAIIFNTFGNSDDIAARGLGNIELTWFYTVFLQEVIRYLDLKRMSGSFDESFCYARNSMLHYARWMVLHEQPTLSRAELLDYPNDTWAAQDIRKANVLYAAYRYAVSDRESFLRRAREFRDYVISTLSKSETLHFSRLQILLLQNHGPSGSMQNPAAVHPGMGDLHTSNVDCFYTFKSLLIYIIRSFYKTVGNFSLKREVNWVKIRFEK